MCSIGSADVDGVAKDEVDFDVEGPERTDLILADGGGSSSCEEDGPCEGSNDDGGLVVGDVSGNGDWLPFLACRAKRSCCFLFIFFPNALALSVACFTMVDSETI